MRLGLKLLVGFREEVGGDEGILDGLSVGVPLGIEKGVCVGQISGKDVCNLLGKAVAEGDGTLLLVWLGNDVGSNHIVGFTFASVGKLLGESTGEDRG